MSFDTIDVTAAAKLLAAEANALYVDVRTVAEFAGGRPKGRAINLPLEFYSPARDITHPNDAFALVAEYAINKNDQLLIGADMGPRAGQAALALAALGFAQILIVEGGIDAWRESGLPVTGDNRDGVSYVSLLTPARRAAEKSKA